MYIADFVKIAIQWLSQSCQIDNKDSLVMLGKIVAEPSLFSPTSWVVIDLGFKWSYWKRLYLLSWLWQNNNWWGTRLYHRGLQRYHCFFSIYFIKIRIWRIWQSDDLFSAPLGSHYYTFGKKFLSLTLILTLKNAPSLWSTFYFCSVESSYCSNHVTNSILCRIYPYLDWWSGVPDYQYLESW